MTEKPEAPAQAATSAPADEPVGAASPYAPSAEVAAGAGAVVGAAAVGHPGEPAVAEPPTADDEPAPAAAEPSSAGDETVPGTAEHAGSPPQAADPAQSSDWFTPATAAEQPAVPPAWNPEQSTAFGSAHVPEADLANAEEQAPPKSETSPETEQPRESSAQMGLTYDQAQHEMLKGMTPEQRIAHFQQETPEQQAAVDTWHRQQFGVPTQSSSKF